MTAEPWRHGGLNKAALVAADYAQEATMQDPQGAPDPAMAAAEAAAAGNAQEADPAATTATATATTTAEADAEKVRKTNSENANLRARLKELEPVAKAAKEAEEANKTEAQKLTEKLTGAETRATASEREVARLRVALAKGLTESQARRLVGDTEDELMTDADELLASFKGEEANGSEAKKPGGRPTEKLKPGTVPAAKSEEKEAPAELAARVPRSW